MTIAVMSQDLNQLRNRLRGLRQQLTPSEQKQHATQALALSKRLLSSAEFSSPQKIALFFTQDGELDTDPLISYFWQETEHEVYLPVLHQLGKKPMTFAHYMQQTELKDNRFQIPEPINTKVITAAELDWVFTPLVAYDQVGNRMGMGGGFYDRTFAFKKNKDLAEKPHLIGWAHSLQKVDRLPVQPWDIPLFALINEQQIEWFSEDSITN